jgi:tetratricopeptide (TPR) repeat protein
MDQRHKNLVCNGPGFFNLTFLSFTMKHLFFLLAVFLSGSFFGTTVTIDSLQEVIKRHSQEDSVKVDLLNAYSWEWLGIHNFDKALHYAVEGQKLAEVLEYRHGLSQSFNYIGIIYWNQGEHAKTLDYFLRMLKVREEIGNKFGIANALSNVGNVYASQMNYPKALEYSLKALAIVEVIDEKDNLSSLLNNIGGIYYEMKDYKKALEIHFRALELNEVSGNKENLSHSYNNIGNVYDELGDHALAMDYYLKSLKLKEELGDKIGIANSLNNLGINHWALGKYREAIRFSNKALSLAKEINFIPVIKDAELSLSNAYKGLHEFEKAFEHYQEFIAARDTLFNAESTRRQVQTEMNFQFEKKEALSKAEQDKKDELTAEMDRRKNVIIGSVIGGLILVIIFLAFLFNRFRLIQTQKQIIEEQKKITEIQKHLVEEKQKELLDSIYYAQRIQRSLLPSEKYIRRNLTSLRG